MRNSKIAFIHNTAIWYRIPVFSLLSKIYDIDFIFTHEKNERNMDFNKVILKNFFGMAVGLFPRILQENYDVIIISGWSNILEFIEGSLCLFTAKLFKKSVIIWLEYWHPPIQDGRRILASSFFGFILKYADACVSPGSKTKEYLMMMGVNENRIFIAPNASLLERETNIDVKKILNIENKKIILYFSRIVPYKGLNYLIQAFSKLEKENKEAYLLVCGSGNFLDYCKRLSKILGINNIRFIGFIEHRYKYSFFSIANVFILPTVFLNGHSEAWGLVLNEAMSLGKPVVSTSAVAAAYDLIENGVNGFLVPEKDVSALYKSIKEIISDPNLEKKMGIQSQEIIEKGYTYKKMVEGFSQAIDYTLGKI